MARNPRDLTLAARHELARMANGDRSGDLVRCPACSTVVTERDRAGHAGRCLKLHSTFELAYPEHTKSVHEAEPARTLEQRMERKREYNRNWMRTRYGTTREQRRLARKRCQK